MTDQNAAKSSLTRRLSDIELRDWQGEAQRLGTFWKNRPIVLVFIRHFG